MARDVFGKVPRSVKKVWRVEKCRRFLVIDVLIAYQGRLLDLRLAGPQHNRVPIPPDFIEVTDGLEPFLRGKHSSFGVRVVNDDARIGEGRNLSSKGSPLSTIAKKVHRSRLKKFFELGHPILPSSRGRA